MAMEWKPKWPRLCTGCLTVGGMTLWRPQLSVRVGVQIIRQDQHTSVNKGQISEHCWGLFLAWEGRRLWQVCSVVFSRLGLEVGHLWAGEDTKHLPLFLQGIWLLVGISMREYLNPSKLLHQRSWTDGEEAEKEKSNCGLHYEFALAQESGADSRRWNLLSWTATLKAITWLSCQLEEYKGAYIGSVWIKRKETDQSMKVNRCLKEQLCTVWVSSRWMMCNPKETN